MNQTQFFLRMFAYDDWANRDTLASLKSSGTIPSRSLKLMSHVIAAERLWLERLEQDEPSLVFWPELNLQECEAHLDDLARSWQRYLNGLQTGDYSRQISYTDSKGEGWTNKVEDALMHVLMHSAQHRGQIALDLRASGQTPAYTDFIQAVRQGFIE
jgi:uncharacterized damage-inducible protein DinB